MDEMSFNEKNKKSNIIRKWETYMQWGRQIAVFHIGEKNYNRFYKESFNELNNILPNLPFFKSAVNVMLFHAVPFMISQYRVLKNIFRFCKVTIKEVINYE
jgi:hypothetical protein